MLVLERRVNQRIFIDGGIEIMVVRMDGDRVYLGITAPPDVNIVRDDAHCREKRQRRNTDLARMRQSE